MITILVKSVYCRLQQMGYVSMSCITNFIYQCTICVQIQHDQSQLVTFLLSQITLTIRFDLVEVVSGLLPGQRHYLLYLIIIATGYRMIHVFHNWDQTAHPSPVVNSLGIYCSNINSYWSQAPSPNEICRTLIKLQIYSKDRSNNQNGRFLSYLVQRLMSLAASEIENPLFSLIRKFFTTTFVVTCIYQFSLPYDQFEIHLLTYLPLSQNTLLH